MRTTGCTPVVFVSVALACVGAATVAQPDEVTIDVPNHPVPADNGWPALVAAAAELEPHRDALYDAHDADWSVEFTMPEVWEAVLVSAREALAKECVHPRPARLLAAVSDAYHVKRLAFAMVLKGRALEREGRYADAARIYVDALKLGPIVARNGDTYHWLIQWSVLKIVAPDLSRCLGARNLVGNDLESLLARLEEAIDGVVPLHEAMAIDWLQYDHEMADMIAREAPLHGRQVDIEAQLAKDARTPLREEMAQAIAAYKDRQRTEPYQTELSGQWLADFITTGYDEPGWKEWEVRALLEGLRAHAAIRLYLRRNGELPASLADLGDVGLEDTPLDPYTGQPMLYVLRDGEYVLYCVGPDRIDGGGTDRLDRETDEGDIIIWPWGGVYQPLPQRGR